MTNYKLLRYLMSNICITFVLSLILQDVNKKFFANRANVSRKRRSKLKNKMNHITFCSIPNVVALTFDDGPQADLTEALLDLFKLKNIKVTFFIIAKNLENQRNVKSARRALNEGHQIGTHTYDHPHMTSSEYSKDLCETLKFEIAKADNLFRKNLNISPRYFRPPYGETNSEIDNQLKKWGYELITWNLDTFDWKWKGMDKLKIVGTYKEGIPEEADGSSFITLQHDKNKEIEAEVERYNYIIDIVEERGFEFVTMEECLNNDESPYFEMQPDYDDCFYK